MTLILTVIVVALIYWRPQTVNRVFGKLQLLSAASMGFMHGTTHGDGAGLDSLNSACTGA